MDTKKSKLLSWLVWFLINPFMWLMFYFGYLAEGIDNVLKIHGVKYPVAATKLLKGGHGGKDVELQINFDGKPQTVLERNCSLSTKIGDQLELVILPSDINVRETLGFSAGNKQQADLNWTFLFFVVLLLSIWHKRAKGKSKVSG